VVLYECLAGRRPFTADSPVATALAHIREPVPPLPDDVPTDLAAVTRRALAKDPAERYPDAAAFAAALRDPAAVGPVPSLAAAAAAAPATAVLTGAVPPATGTGPAPGEPGRRRRPSPWLLAIPLALLAGVVVWALVAGNGDDPGPTTDEPTSSQGSPEQDGTTPSASPEEPTTAPTTEPTVQTVTVDPADYVGRPVADVERELGDLGLVVTTQEVENTDGGETDTVTAVEPSGELQEGDAVTVSYLGEPVTPPPTNENDGNVGNDGNNGNGNGNR
jgi:serine/threonine-protein kinase